MAARVGVDGDPLLVRLEAFRVVRCDEIRMAIVGGYPLGGGERPVRPDRYRDHLRWDRGVGLLVLVDLEVVGAVRVVIELIGQVEQVEVAETIEGSDRIGVVTPAFVAWDMP